MWPAYYGGDGIRLKTSKWKRPSPESAPTASKCAGLYVLCTLARDEAVAAGYQDAFMLDYRGRVAEATGANLFFVKGGELHTPEADCFLNGITRQTVIGLAREHGMSKSTSGRCGRTSCTTPPRCSSPGRPSR